MIHSLLILVELATTNHFFSLFLLISFPSLSLSKKERTELREQYFKKQNLHYTIGRELFYTGFIFILNLPLWLFDPGRSIK